MEGPGVLVICDDTFLAVLYLGLCFEKITLDSRYLRMIFDIHGRPLLSANEEA